MPFETPNLPTLVARASADLEGSAGLRRSDGAVLARVHPAAVYGLYQYMDWQYRQLFPDSAEEEALLRHGSSRGVFRKDATHAGGVVLFAGGTDSEVDEGTRLERDGVLYEVLAGVTLVGGAAVAAIRAVDGGVQGNQPAGTVLQLVSPVLGVESSVTVGAAGITGGTDVEDLEDCRARVMARFRNVPHGGSADDYVSWATDQPGVTRAWCRRNWVGPGTVGVFVVNDATADITLPAADLDRIKAALEALRPVTPELVVRSPVLRPVAYRIELTPDEPRVRAAVEMALQQLHDRESDLGARMLWTHMGEAISGAAGEKDHTLVQPSDDVVPAAGELLVYGGVEWL